MNITLFLQEIALVNILKKNMDGVHVMLKDVIAKQDGKNKLTYVAPIVIKNYTRVSSNGKMLDFHSKNVGSIPSIRFLEDTAGKAGNWCWMPGYGKT